MVAVVVTGCWELLVVGASTPVDGCVVVVDCVVAGVDGEGVAEGSEGGRNWG